MNSLKNNKGRAVLTVDTLLYGNASWYQYLINRMIIYTYEWYDNFILIYVKVDRYIFVYDFGII